MVLWNDEADAPYASTKIDVVSAIITVFVMPNCFANAMDAGATIEDETGLMNVNAEMMAVAAHLRLKLQLKQYDKRRAYDWNEKSLLTF